ncbi:MAG: glutaredoxin domain-containing protein [Candidatus Pacebacteria bacterium]|nr:glutaredoxin domain-containing protein [Candidatus Paceibacterota bacterium]
MIKKYFFFFTVLALIFSWNGLSAAQEGEDSYQNPEIYFFSSQTCPHCAQERQFLETLKEKYPEIEIKEYEVVFHPENQPVLQDFYNRYNVPSKDQGWVPVTFTSNKYFVGFNDQTAREIENCLEECINGKTGESDQNIILPLIGKIDVSNFSLPVLTIIFGVLDGFNPCAMWILILLLALLINTRSRKRMWFVGGTFILVSGVIYYLILSAWLNLFLAISYVNITRIAIGLVALGIGAWQIKNFIQFRPGVCKVTDGKAGFQEKLKEKLKGRAEKIALSPFTFAILGGTVLLAIGVNVVEFFCSAGLPAIYTRILSLSDLSSASYYLYLLLYTLFFMLDDAIVFFLAVITLNRFGFTQKYNYWSTLIGGLLIIILGILLIFKPQFLMFG